MSTDKIETRVALMKGRIAPRKMRNLVNAIRGVSLAMALNILSNSPKRCASILRKLLLSAVANLSRICLNEKLDLNSFFIAMICVNPAGMLKRVLRASQGRTHMIRKRFSHIVLVVRQY